MSEVMFNKTYRLCYSPMLFKAIKHIKCMSDWQHAIIKIIEPGYTSGTVWVTERFPGKLSKKYGRVLVDKTILEEIVDCVCSIKTLNLSGCRCGGN